MQITSNTTGFLADIAVATDLDARDHCVLVIKGTFGADEAGRLRPASLQREFVRSDEHDGDPATTAVLRESEFAPRKPSVDIVVEGQAISPGGQPMHELVVALDINGRRKVAVVTGERRWVRAAGGFVASSPVPFREMPLSYDRAFGGVDDTEAGATVAEHRNLVGVGFQPNRPAADIENRSLPNIERPEDRVKGPRSKVSPIGFGCLGRASLPRRKFAGTYDEAWLENVAPFLPSDFDERYFQCAPPDQQLSRVEGGERLRCIHMSADPVVEYVLPSLTLPTAFRFDDHVLRRRAEIDTVILLPNTREACLVWRCSVPLPKKIHRLHAIEIGETPATEDGVRGFRNGKPLFRSLGEAVRWLGNRRKSP